MKTKTKRISEIKNDNQILIDEFKELKDRIDFYITRLQNGEIQSNGSLDEMSIENLFYDVTTTISINETISEELEFGLIIDD